MLNLMRHLGPRHGIDYLCGLRPGEEAHLPEMEALGLRVETVPAREPARGTAGFYARALANLASRHPYSVSRNYDPALRRKARALAAERSYDLVICDTPQMARHVLDLPGGAPKILFQHNVESQILLRHADPAANASRLKARYMALQARRMLAFERSLGPAFDRVVAVSRNDKATFERLFGWEHVDAIDTSVDLEYFQPRPGASVAGRVAFVGSMDWMPNQDGIRRFLDRVWPLVRAEVPGATFHVAGRRPPEDIRARDGREGVRIAGTVPDVRPHIAEAEVAVVPLWVGGGTRLKIYEYVAMGVPVASTAIGAEGLPLEDRTHIRLADEDRSLADAVIELLRSAELRRTLASNALRLVRERYGTEPVARQFEEICERTVRSRTSAR